MSWGWVVVGLWLGGRSFFDDAVLGGRSKGREGGVSILESVPRLPLFILVINHTPTCVLGLLT